MTRDEAKQVLVTMATAWPQRELTKPEREMWLRDLEALAVVEAFEAVDSCRSAYDWLPTWNQYRSTYLGITNRRRDYERASRALMPAPEDRAGDAERAREHIAGRGRPRDAGASLAYSAEWAKHLRAGIDRIGRGA